MILPFQPSPFSQEFKWETERNEKPHVLLNEVIDRHAYTNSFLSLLYVLVQAPLTGIFHPTKNGFDPSGYGRVRATKINLTNERKTYAPDQVP